MTHAYLKTPVLRDLLAARIRAGRQQRDEALRYGDDKHYISDWYEIKERAAVPNYRAAILDVQAAINRGDLVTREEYRSEVYWAETYFHDWLSADERLDNVRRAMITE